MSALERLDAIDARTTAATPGPWIRWGNAIRLTDEVTELGFLLTGSATPRYRDDADFMASAREDVPAMATALRALLALHTPEEQRVGPSVCAGCSNALARYLYPCPTVRIIETELGR